MRIELKTILFYFIYYHEIVYKTFQLLCPIVQTLLFRQIIMKYNGILRVQFTIEIQIDVK